MTLSIPVPDDLDLATVKELDHAAREVVGVRLYKQGKLSHGKLAKFLGIGRGEVDDLLNRYGPFDEFTAREIADQADTLCQLRLKHP